MRNEPSILGAIFSATLYFPSSRICILPRKGPGQSSRSCNAMRLAREPRSKTHPLRHSLGAQQGLAPVGEQEAGNTGAITTRYSILPLCSGFKRHRAYPGRRVRAGALCCRDVRPRGDKLSAIMLRARGGPRALFRVRSFADVRTRAPRSCGAAHGAPRGNDPVPTLPPRAVPGIASRERHIRSTAVTPARSSVFLSARRTASTSTRRAPVRTGSSVNTRHCP